MFYPPNLTIPVPLSLSSLEKKEDTAFKLAETRIAALNASVDSDIQVLFDRLSFIYSCKWDGSSIVVLDEYIIEAPYQSVRVIDGKEGSGLERLKKIVRPFTSLLLIIYVDRVSVILISAGG